MSRCKLALAMMQLFRFTPAESQLNLCPQPARITAAPVPWPSGWGLGSCGPEGLKYSQPPASVPLCSLCWRRVAPQQLLPALLISIRIGSSSQGTETIAWGLCDQSQLSNPAQPKGWMWSITHLQQTAADLLCAFPFSLRVA